MANIWNADNIGDLTGKAAIITGANTGIGKETARVLASKGAEVVMAVRSTAKGESASAEIREQHRGANVKVMHLDLASLESVKEFCSTFTADYDQLHYLINNAGVMIPPYSKTVDGFELQFGTNHLGHFALTARLFPLLKATPGARITSVSSGAHAVGNINFDDLNWEKRSYQAATAYGDSKLANLLFTYELSRKLANSDITITAAHPGWTATDLQRHSGLFKLLNVFFAQNPPMGALPTLRATIDPEARNGDYYGPRGLCGMSGYPVKVKSNDRSHDLGTAGELWSVSESLTSVRFEGIGA